MNLMDQFTKVDKKVHDELLPGWEQLCRTNENIKPHIDRCHDRCVRAIKDEDEILLDRAIKDYLKGWRRVNELLAQDYMENNPDPTAWELRYLKWVRPGYIKFDSARGPFYIIIGKPDRNAPTDAPCFTVDEVLVMLHPITSEVINTFDALPTKAVKFKPPEFGESVDHIFVEEDGVRFKTDLGRPRRRRGGG